MRLQPGIESLVGLDVGLQLAQRVKPGLHSRQRIDHLALFVAGGDALRLQPGLLLLGSAGPADPLFQLPAHPLELLLNQGHVALVGRLQFAAFLAQSLATQCQSCQLGIERAPVLRRPFDRLRRAGRVGPRHRQRLARRVVGRLERGQSRVVLVAGRTGLLVLLAALADRDIQLGPAL